MAIYCESSTVSGLGILASLTFWKSVENEKKMKYSSNIRGAIPEKIKEG